MSTRYYGTIISILKEIGILCTVFYKCCSCCLDINARPCCQGLKLLFLPTNILIFDISEKFPIIYLLPLKLLLRVIYLPSIQKKFRTRWAERSKMHGWKSILKKHDILPNGARKIYNKRIPNTKRNLPYERFWRWLKVGIASNITKSF